jgi:hypothetical protein
MEETKPSVTREEAIAKLREKLWSMTGEDECACVSTARRGVFCQGLNRLGDGELHARYAWLGKNRPSFSRRQLEDLVVAHHTSRVESTHSGICCDVETRERGACEGWDMFDNPALETQLQALGSQPVHVR